MNIGIPTEIKPNEGRVALLPQHVERLVAEGHRVTVQRGAGRHAEADDANYEAAGASLAEDARALFDQSTLIVKVKEVLQSEFALLRPNHIVLGQLFYERDRGLLDRFRDIGLTAIALERLRVPAMGSNPAAGEIAALEGLHLLLSPHGGRGRHFAKHAGVAPARVLVIGLGAAGNGALGSVLALGASAVGFDCDPFVLARAASHWANSDFEARHVDRLSDFVAGADLVINCVAWDKSRRDHLITRDMLSRMREGSVIVDVSCDRAGAIETSVPTTWDNPTYRVHGVTHFCVENLASAIPAAASASFGERALVATRAIAASGVAEACRLHDWLQRALVCHHGVLTVALPDKRSR